MYVLWATVYNRRLEEKKTNVYHTSASFDCERQLYKSEGMQFVVVRRMLDDWIITHVSAVRQ